VKPIEKYDLEQMMKQCKRDNLYAIESSAGTVCTLRVIFKETNCEYLGDQLIAIPNVYCKCEKYNNKS
tara:strand:- start:4985 stop:5188 length:204 start_codon:yes stop_codon:yes gene_type:complete